VNEERFLRRSTTSAVTTSRDGCCPRATARQGEDTACTRGVVAAQKCSPPADVDDKRRAVRPAWTSERRREPRPDDTTIDVPAERPVTAQRDVRHSLSTEKVGGPPCCGKSSQHAAVGGSGRVQQSAADCTDQLTSDIYATLAAYRDVQENVVIDAVRGYLCRPPSPPRHRRPSTARRPGSARDGRDGSRSVQLRQGDVGPLSSLVVIRPATPRPRTNGGPASGRPRTAGETATASGDGRRAQWQHDCGSAQSQHPPPPPHHHHRHHHQQQKQQQQQQRLVVRASSLINDDDAWFSTSDCQQ